MKNAETYSKATLGSELYEVKMKIIPSEQNVLSAVKRDSPATDLPTWHRWLGQLGDSLLKKTHQLQDRSRPQSDKHSAQWYL